MTLAIDRRPADAIGAVPESGIAISSFNGDPGLSYFDPASRKYRLLPLHPDQLPVLDLLGSTIGATTIPAPVTTFRTSGQSVFGIGQASFTRSISTSTNPTLLRDKSGAYFERCDPVAAIEAFGALAADIAKSLTYQVSSAVAFNKAFAYAAWRASQKISGYAPPVAELVTFGPGLFVFDAGTLLPSYVGHVSLRGAGSAQTTIGITTTVYNAQSQLVPRPNIGLNFDIGTDGTWPVKSMGFDGLSIVDFDQGGPTTAALVRTAHFNDIFHRDAVFVSGFGVAYYGYKNVRYHGSEIDATSARNVAVRLNGANGRLTIKALNQQAVASGSNQQVSYGPAVHLTGALRSVVLDVFVAGAGALRNYTIASIASDTTGFTAQVPGHDFRANELFTVSGNDKSGYNGVWRITSVGAGTVRITDPAAANLSASTVAGTCSSEVAEVIWDSEDDAGGGESVIRVFAESTASGSNAQGLDKANKACFGLILDGSRNQNFNGNPAGLSAIKAEIFSDAGYSTVLCRGGMATGGYSLCREISFDGIYSRVEGGVLQLEGFCYDVRAPSCSFQGETASNNSSAFTNAGLGAGLTLVSFGNGNEPLNVVYGTTGTRANSGNLTDTSTIPIYGVQLVGAFSGTLSLCLLGHHRGKTAAIGPLGINLESFYIDTKAATLVTGTMEPGNTVQVAVSSAGVLDLAGVAAYNDQVHVTNTSTAIKTITGGYISRRLFLVGADGPISTDGGGNIPLSFSGYRAAIAFNNQALWF